MQKILWLLLFVLPVYVLPSHALATTTDEETSVDEDWYQIELVVLRHLNSEQYLVDLPFSGAPDFSIDEHYTLVQGSAITSTHISEINSENLAIKEKYDTLARSRNYRPILLTGWKMHLPPGKEELPVRITAGDSFDNSPEFEGYISVKRNRYLHVYADLALSEFVEKEEVESDNLLDAILNQQQPMTTLFYQQDNPPSGTEAMTEQATTHLDQTMMNDTNNYLVKSHQRLKESRRLRSDELHYLDHPTMGILLRIIPTTAPVVPEQAPETAPEETAHQSPGEPAPQSPGEPTALRPEGDATPLNPQITP